MASNSIRVGNRRVRMLREHGRHCHWCGDRMTWPDYSEGAVPENAMTIEHLLPRSLGGGNDPYNLVLACLACNHERGTGFYFEPLRRWACGPEGAQRG